jgi:predicted nucleic acid-binding protein
MCIVIDTNVWPLVFRSDAVRHRDYIPVLKWITEGPGFIVYGGSKYETELKKAPNYLNIFVELNKKGRAKHVDSIQVDEHQIQVEQAVNTAKCNDAHLIAIFRVSGCRLLCTEDKKSFAFIKNKKFYLRGQRPPSIYCRSCKQHRRLLCLQNVVQIRNEIP